MRLEGQSKLGYYPTPENSLNLILTWLRTSDSEGLRRYLDPCCGKGEALAAIAAAHGPAETFGIELSDVRAADAERALNHVLNTAYEYAVLSDETFSLILLNPPYDGESTTGGGRRMEETFLLDSTPRLGPAGVLIYVIPHHRINEKIARHLVGWYDDLRCFKLAGDDYDTFNQVVIFGLRREGYTPASGDDLRAVQAWAEAKIVTGYQTVETAVADEQTTDGQPKRKKVRQPVYGDLPELSTGQGAYPIPLSPLRGRRGAFRFQYVPVSDDDYLRAAADAVARLEAGREWRALIPATEPPIIEPAMTPKKGHIAMQVSGGLLGTNLVRAPDQAPLLIKGHVRKTSRTVTHAPDEDPAARECDHKRLSKVEIRQQFETALATLDEHGDLQITSQPEAIKQLLDVYVEQLAEIVQARNAPQYDMMPEKWEWRVFDDLSKGRKLPGREEMGLTDFQKHLAIALGRLCLKHGAGIVTAEMGSGKSTIFLAIAEYVRAAQARRGGRAGAYPALIVAPGVVTGTENWPKEIAEVIPGAASRVITIGAKPLPKPVKVGEWLRSQFASNPQPRTTAERRQFTLEIEVADEYLKDDEFEGLPPAEFMERLRQVTRRIKDTEVRKRFEQRLKQALTPLRYTLTAAWRNPPRRRPHAKDTNLLDARIGGLLWLGLNLPRDLESERTLDNRYSLLQFAADYRAGALPEKSFAIMSYETAKLGSGRVPAMVSRRVRRRYRDEHGRLRTEFSEVCTCPTCGAIVAEEYDEDGSPVAGKIITPAQSVEWVGLRRRFCQAPQARRVWDDEHGRHVTLAADEDGVRHVCGAPLFEVSELRRLPAATVARRLKKFFGLLGVDEVHKCKAKGTGVGWALTVLHNACRYTVGLTGTLYGGYSTSIFWLMHRLSAEVRREFGYSDERRWVEKYGLLRTTFYVDNLKAFDGEDGAYTGTKEYLSVSEMPGLSPAIAGLGLKYCTFSSLNDIGLPLPDYSEEIVRLEMTDEMKAQMQKADGHADGTGLYAWAMNRTKDEDGKGAISVWLNTALNRPDAMFQSEVVTFHPRVSGRGRFTVRREETVMTLPAVAAPDEWLPKERWLARQCMLERDQGGKTLIGVRQTGERDIQPRLQQALEAVGLRVGILRPSLAPARRGAWIKYHEHEFDVLLTNARLVEVGLNLTMFNTAILYECEWSLYVLWQFMRRLYRPGASKRVRLYFPVYRDTLEESALDLIGHKMLAAQLFYGDSVGGALVDELDEGDLLGDLVRKAMGRLNVGRAEGIFSIGSRPAVASSAIGSLVLASPALKTFAELAALRQRFMSAPRRSLVRKVVVSDRQLPLL